MDDIVVRIRKRFPHPKDADDGLLSNEAADEILRLRALLTEATAAHGRISEVLAGLSRQLYPGQAF